PPAEFTPRRTAKARELKAAGQAPLAAEVSSLRKPPVALWAANQVARREGASLDRLRRAAEEVVGAQQAAVLGRSGAAADLRRASGELQRQLERAAGVAGAALREEGHAADEATARRLREILRVAAVSGGEVWNRLRKGALLTEPRAGEELLDVALAIGPQAAAPPPLPSPLKGEGDSSRRREKAKERDAERQIEARAAARTARADAERAERAAKNARRL